MYNISSGTPVNIYNPMYVREKSNHLITSYICDKITYNIENEERKKIRSRPKKEARGLCFIREIKLPRRENYTGSPIHRAGDLSQIL